MPARNEARSQPAVTLVSQVSEKLRQDIASGVFAPGDKLPSEAELTRAHKVSRTVVREAIAALRSDGLVEARKGAGVFARAGVVAPFGNLDLARLSSAIELLELRIAVEVESAALAALRKSAAQEEEIVLAHREVIAALEEGRPTGDADFALHIAIARASNNPRFSEFLELIRPGIVPRASFGAGKDGRPINYNTTLREEHEEIVTAILNTDAAGARDAMRRHLTGSQRRYRELLYRTKETGGAV